MNNYNLYIIISMLIGAIGIFIGTFKLFITSENCEKIAKIARERYIATIIWGLCITWCIPHTQVIIFKVLVPYLWYIGAILVILSYFYLDYLFARAFAGAMIIGAYYMVNSAFQYHSPIAIFVSIAAWLIGIIGIVISGRPSLLRDIIRLNGRDKKVKITGSILFYILGAIMVINGVIGLIK